MFASRGLRVARQLVKRTNSTIPQFTVGCDNGFLPREPPLEVLPAQFDKLESLLERMPIKCADGSEGLLKHGTFAATVDKELPDYTAEVKKTEDSQLLTALFRDYTFLASSYLLEPCDLEYRKTKTYGLGNQTLPRNIAVPLSIVAQKIKAKPYMEYAMSYALYNYGHYDKEAHQVMDYSNLKLIRKFDGSDAEHGFILVHVAMVSYSGELVRQVRAALDAASWKDRKEFDLALSRMHANSVTINRTMETMWNRSSSEGYNNFRTFIMGTKNQPMFPNGVLYEGVSETPTQYRGESGANDSMIPTMDNFLQVTSQLPENPLTDVLKDFRSYRPGDHNDFLGQVKERADAVGVLEFAKGSAESSVLYLQNLDMVREFRMRHWNFTKEYILKYSEHAVGTGGSPIVSWLPNQLGAVMDIMLEVGGSVDKSQLSGERLDTFNKLMSTADAQNRVLRKEVETLKVKYPDTHSVAEKEVKTKDL